MIRAPVCSNRGHPASLTHCFMEMVGKAAREHMRRRRQQLLGQDGLIPRGNRTVGDALRERSSPDLIVCIPIQNSRAPRHACLRHPAGRLERRHWIVHHPPIGIEHAGCEGCVKAAIAMPGVSEYVFGAIQTFFVRKIAARRATMPPTEAAIGSRSFACTSLSEAVLTAQRDEYMESWQNHATLGHEWAASR